MVTILLQVISYKGWTILGIFLFKIKVILSLQSFFLCWKSWFWWFFQRIYFFHRILSETLQVIIYKGSFLYRILFRVKVTLYLQSFFHCWRLCFWWFCMRIYFFHRVLSEALQVIRYKGWTTFRVLFRVKVTLYLQSLLHCWRSWFWWFRKRTFFHSVLSEALLQSSEVCAYMKSGTRKKNALCACTSSPYSRLEVIITRSPIKTEIS